MDKSKFIDGIWDALRLRYMWIRERGARCSCKRIAYLRPGLDEMAPLSEKRVSIIGGNIGDTRTCAPQTSQPQSHRNKAVSISIPRKLLPGLGPLKPGRGNKK
jgi:hypothetical protein